MSAPFITPPLAELAAAQGAKNIFAFSLNEESRLVNRLRTVHAKQVAQLDAFGDLLAETSPDMILRAADGREVVLRLPSDEMRSLCCSLREVLEHQIRGVEQRIVEELLQLHTFSQPDPSDIRPAILALCQPAAAAVAEQPSNSPVVTVGQLEQHRTPPLSAAA